jgi:type I restriction enzyme M protein
VQKWNDDPEAGELCPYKEDYNIFFATQQTKGKDNSCDKIFAKDKDGNLLLDKNGHRFVEHDLFSVELADGGKTPAGIAEAFIEFASKEKLSFF